MKPVEFRAGLIPLRELYSDKFTQWHREFMSTGALPLGPAALVARPNDCMLAPFTNGAHVVMRNDEGKLGTFFNVCPHRRKTLFKIPSGDTWRIKDFTTNSRFIVCPGHNLIFTTGGVSHPNGSGCAGLISAGETRDIGGLLWVGSTEELDRVASIFKLSLMQKHGIDRFIPKGYALHAVKVCRMQSRPTTNLGVYGDIWHIIAAYHNNTLKQHTDISRLEIDVSAPCESVSVQVVPWIEKGSTTASTRAWAEWGRGVKSLQEKYPDDASLRKIVWGQESRGGWTGEWYPGMYTDSVFIPDPDGTGTINVVAFYFLEEILNTRDPEIADTDFGGDLVHWATKAYWKELAPEDAVLCKEEDDGCRTLIRCGKGDLTSGYYRLPEEGVSYQYEKYLARHWNAYKARSS